MRPVVLAPGYALADFTALLKSRQFAYAEAFTLILLDGTVLAYTTAQFDFTVPPYDAQTTTRTYKARDVLISGLKFKVSNGQSEPGEVSATIEVDEQSVTFTPRPAWTSPMGVVSPGPTIAGLPWLQAVKRGKLDAAKVYRDRWYFQGPNLNPVGGIPLFYGFAAAVDQLSRTQAVIKVKSDIALLNVQMPRNLYQPNCQYTVFSTGCGAVKSAYAFATLVLGSGTLGPPSTSYIPWIGSTGGGIPSAAQFTGGTIDFTSGPNTGIIATILRADNFGLTLSYPLPFVPNVADTFTAYPGCDRQYTGGCAFFGRQAAHRSTPFVPQAQFGI